MTERTAFPESTDGLSGAEGGWHVPSPAMLRMRQVEVAAVILPLAFLTGLSFGIKHGVVPGIVSSLIVVVFDLVFSWFFRRRYQAWKYQERHEDLVVARGVMVRRLSVIPYGRMQFVELSAGPFERMFKLSTVKLHTAAAASDARIPGLAQEEAARLRDRLTELGESKAAGL